jgi:hypothetical protein
MGSLRIRLCQEGRKEKRMKNPTWHNRLHNSFLKMEFAQSVILTVKKTKSYKTNGTRRYVFSTVVDKILWNVMHFLI